MDSWYCIYTKPKQEDIVGHKLVEHSGIEIFCPKLIAPKRLRGSTAQSVQELFPCYLFAKFEDPKYFHMIRYTRGVRRFVGDSTAVPYVVDQNIIETIRTRMKDGFVRIEPVRFAPGEKIMIMDGPFSGFSGVFLSETKPRERVMILLSLIQYQAKVELPGVYVARM